MENLFLMEIARLKRDKCLKTVIKYEITADHSGHKSNLSGFRFFQPKMFKRFICDQLDMDKLPMWEESFSGGLTAQGEFDKSTPINSSIVWTS